MLSVACIALVVVLLFLLRQRSIRAAQKHVTDAWRDASELAFDRDLRFYIAREARSGEKPDVYPDYQHAKQLLVTHLATQLLVLAQKRLGRETPLPQVEDFVAQHCDLSDEALLVLWIDELS